MHTLKDSKSTIYFASDVHLGARFIPNPKKHEQQFIDWLDFIKPTADKLYLMGDIFDFWFEYKHVVPKEHFRTLAKLSELADNGTEVHFFHGNHDMWTQQFLQQEIGIIVHSQAEIHYIQGKRVYLSHGHWESIQKKRERFMFSIFSSRFLYKLYSTLVHPDLNMFIGKLWSKGSRLSSKDEDYSAYLGEDREYLVQFAKRYIQQSNDAPELFIFGHRHIALDLALAKNSRIIILGEWISNPTFASIEPNGFVKLTTFPEL